MARHFACAILFSALAFTVPAGAADARDAASEADSENTQASLRGMLENVAGEGESNQSNVDAKWLLLARIARFYDSRDYQPIWSGNDDANDNLRHLLLVLQHADQQGLPVSDYLDALSKWRRHAPKPGKDAALYEVTLTGALFRYASDVRTGKFPPSAVYPDAQLPPRNFDPGENLNHAIRRGSLADYLASLPRTDQAYQGLVAALARYRAIALVGGWPHVGAGNRTNLAKRLALEDPALAAIDAPTAADTTAALMRYQARNGFTQEETLRPEVLATLNQPVSFRIAQIIANLERRRWLPETRENTYIEVNVAGQSLDFVHRGQVLLHSRVIIGKPTTPTPILRTEVKAVVANPPWDIPDFIAGKTLLPHLRRDPSYLASHNIVLADGPADDPHGLKIDWSKVTPHSIPYQIQQLPSADNALGVLMLDMPNDFDVYLHDTPDKKLFAGAMREHSNGCVRVQQILPLASLVLTRDASEGLDQINRAVATGATQRFTLSEPMPVYLLYWTAIPEADGTVGFRPDRYGRDRALIAMLAPGSGAKTSPASLGKKRPASNNAVAATKIPTAKPPTKIEVIYSREVSGAQ